MQAKDLIVLGSSRLLGKLYCGDIDIDGTASFTGNLSVSGKTTTNQLVVTNTTDISGTSSPSNAPFVVGSLTGQHIEIDDNEIIAKNSSATSPLYLHTTGGVVFLSGSTIKADGSTFTAPTISNTNLTSTNIMSNTITNSGNINNRNGIIETDEIQSNVWNIVSMQNLGGDFFVAPTIMITEGSTFYINSISNGVIAGYIIDSTNITSDAFAGHSWTSGSKIKITGKITQGSNSYILGTCDGTLTANMNSSSGRITFSVTCKAVTLPTSIGSYTISDGTVMMYSVGGSNKVGIYMTSYGIDHSEYNVSNANKRNKYSYIDIFNGADGANPKVRIGKLDGLPAINSISPTGYGIYTTNGYFQGLIVANGGKIAGWTIGDEYITTNSERTTYNSESKTGMTMTASGIGAYASSSAKFTLSTAGVLTATGANITGVINADTGRIGGSSGWTIASQQISSGTLGSDNSMYLATKNLGSNTSIAGRQGSDWRFTVGSKFGVTNSGAIYAASGKIASWDIESNDLKTGTWGSENSAMLCTGSTSSKSIGGSGSINGWVFTAGANFGVTKTGALYANSANITGALTATSLTINSGATVSGDGASQILNSDIEVGGRNLLIGTGSSPLVILDSTITNGYYEEYSVNLKNLLNSVVLVEGETYTFSGYVSSTVVPFCISVGAGNGVYSRDIAVTNNNLQNGHFELTFTPTATSLQRGAVFSFRAPRYNAKTTFTYSINNLKLEKGNKATDWSPAPEDLEAYADTAVSNFGSRFTVTPENISSEVTALANGSEIASRINQTANTVKIAASKVEIDGTAVFNAISSSVQSTVDDTVEQINKETISRGEQLVTNGNGMTGDNTNFSQLTFDGSNSNYSPGSFTRTATNYVFVQSDDYFPIDVSKRYRFEMDVKSRSNLSTMYSMIVFYDVDKNTITAPYHMYRPNTLTTLARELKAGDTVVYLTSVANYTTLGTGTHQRALIFWDYKNSFGYQYPPETYSRNCLMPAWTDNNSIDSTNNTITLASAYTGKTHPAGTYVSQGHSGGNYKYTPLNNTKIPATWTHYTGYYDGVDLSGTNVTTKFPPGTAYGKVGLLWNYNKANDQIWVTNIQVYEDYKTDIAKALNKRSIHTLDSSYSRTYSTLIGWTAEGLNSNWNVASTNNVSVGDTVRIKCTVSDMSNTPVYAIGTVTAINGSTSLGMTSHGIDTTVIDGGKILTGTITADQIQGNTLTIGKFTSSDQNSILNSNIEVGGRNLLLDTKNVMFAASYTDFTVTSGISNVATTDNLILSFWAKGSVAMWCDFYFVKNTTSYTGTSYFYPSFQITTDWQFFRYSGTASSVAATATVLRLRENSTEHGSASNRGTLYIKELKLEKGNKATEWSPAPEEVESDIANAEATATSYITYVSANDGIKVHNSGDETDYVQVNSTAIKMYRNNVEKMLLNDTSFRIGGVGSNIRNVYITDSAVQIRNNTSVLAEYGSAIKLYKPGTTTEVVTIDSNGGSFTGGITATSGTIGSGNTKWNIGSGMIYSGSNVPGTNSSTLVISTGTTSNKTIGGSTSGVGYTWMIAAGTGFGVTNTGDMYSKSGLIGGWTISDTSLSYGSWGESSSAMLCAKGTSTAKSIGGSPSTVSGWVLTAGNGFGVTKAGVLYANSANITGSIVATSLTINSGATISGDGAGPILNSNIKVGGGNVLRNSEILDISKTPYTNSTATTYNNTFNGAQYYYCSGSKYIQVDFPTLLAGEEYYFSFDVGRAAGGVNTYVTIAGGTATNVGVTSTSVWKRFTYLFTASNSTTYVRLNVQNATSGGNATYYAAFKDFKLEKGNRVTDWSPANEDVASDISDASKTATNCITEISDTGIWVTPSGKKPTNTSTGAGATGTKIDATGVGIYKDGAKLAEYGTSTKWYSPDGQYLAAKVENHSTYGSLMVINHLVVSSSSNPSVNDMWIGPSGISTTRSYEDGSTWAECVMGINGGEIHMDSHKSDATGLIGAISIKPGRILATSYENSPVEANIRAASAAGSIYMYSQPTSSGNRGIYAIDSSNAYKAVIDITSNNLCYFRGAADSISDLKKKDVITDYDWKIDDFINGLKPIAYRFKHDDGSLGDRIRMGFGAQDIRDLTKSLYDEELSLYRARIIDETKEGTEREQPYHGEDIDDKNLSWSLTYEELIAPMVLEIQRLMNRVNKLELEIRTLKNNK